MDFRKINKILKDIDPTTPDQDLYNTSMLAESLGIDVGVEKEQLTEKAVSKAQQKLMGQAYALKKGDMKAKDASKEVKKLAKEMSKSDLKDFASTKHKGKPEHVKKESVKENLTPQEADQKLTDKQAKQKALQDIQTDPNTAKDPELKKELMRRKAEVDAMKESVKLVDDFGEVFEAQSAKQKAAFKKMLDAKKGKKSDDKEPEKTKYSLDDLKKGRDELAARTDVLTKMGKEDINVDEAAKPDFLDMDKDGDKKEPMKKALKDKKKKQVKESADPMKFIEMMKMVRESGGQQAIDPMDDVLWSWANRVAKSKVQESNKQEIFAAMVYERNGGRFEMYDIMEKGLNEGKDCNCGPDCACKGNCGSNCNCGPNCGK